MNTDQIPLYMIEIGYVERREPDGSIRQGLYVKGRFVDMGEDDVPAKLKALANSATAAVVKVIHHNDKFADNETLVEWGGEGSNTGELGKLRKEIDNEVIGADQIL